MQESKKDMLRVGCVLMAAGLGRRFGGDKLLAEYAGRPLIDWALGAIPAEQCSSVSVVAQNRAILQRAAALDFCPVENPAPELGISHSLQLGLRSIGDCDGCLFLVADQPRLRRASVARLMQAWHQCPEKIAALTFDGRRGNPCLFPSRFFPDLYALTGDKGGRSVIAANPNCLLTVPVGRAELLDIDTREDLLRLPGP